LTGGCQHPTVVRQSGARIPLNLTKPDLSSTTAYILPEGGPYGRSKAPGAEIRLPKGMQQGDMPFDFLSKQGAYVSVFPDVPGPSHQEKFKELQSKKTRAIVAGDWIGSYSEEDVRGGARTGRLCKMYSATGYYSLMVSWPERNSGAELDANSLLRDVIWSYHEFRP
jgi:hypothetical protein